MVACGEVGDTTLSDECPFLPAAPLDFDFPTSVRVDYLAPQGLQILWPVQGTTIHTMEPDSLPSGEHTSRRTTFNHSRTDRHWVFCGTPVEDAYSIWTRRHAVTTSDALVLVDKHNSFGVRVCGRSWTHLFTWSVIAVLTCKRNPMQFMIAVLIDMGSIKCFSSSENTVPPQTQWHSIFALANHRTRPTTDTTLKVNCHPPTRMFGAHIDRSIFSARRRQRFDGRHSGCDWRRRCFRHDVPRSCNLSNQ